jgi:hypothetical protein
MSNCSTCGDPKPHPKYKLCARCWALNRNYESLLQENPGKAHEWIHAKMKELHNWRPHQFIGSDPVGHDDECPGEGKCHGSMNWCERCGDVVKVCDDVNCDLHRQEVANGG